MEYWSYGYDNPSGEGRTLLRPIAMCGHDSACPSIKTACFALFVSLLCVLVCSGKILVGAGPCACPNISGQPQGVAPMMYRLWLRAPPVLLRVLRGSVDKMLEYWSDGVMETDCFLLRRFSFFPVNCQPVNTNFLSP